MSEIEHLIRETLVIFAWEKGRVPNGLRQLEALKGNSTNSKSYPFPVQMERIEGASWDTVVEHPSQIVLENMIHAAKQYEKKGARAIITSCGFNAIFQKQIAASIAIPFASSSLLQIPLIQSIFGKEAEIVVITARKKALSAEHFQAVGVEDMEKIALVDMGEVCPEWRKVNSFTEFLDLPVLEREIVFFAQELKEMYPHARAILLECTDLPPFSEIFKIETGLPVFDIISLAKYIVEVSMSSGK